MIMTKNKNRSSITNSSSSSSSRDRHRRSRSRSRWTTLHNHPLLMLMLMLMLMLSLTNTNNNSNSFVVVESLITGPSCTTTNNKLLLQQRRQRRHHHQQTSCLTLVETSSSSVRTKSSFKLYAYNNNNNNNNNNESSDQYENENENENENEKYNNPAPAPAPRRTRRIDEILFGDDPKYEDDDDENCDVALTMSVNSLQSTLKSEKEKSSTLAVKLAYAEQVIAEQKKRLDTKRESLALKDRKLKELENKFTVFNNNQVVPAASAPPTSPSSSSPVTTTTTTTTTPNNNSPPPLKPPITATKKKNIFPPVPWQYPPLTSKERQYPLISYWSLNTNSDEVTGTVTCHPSIPDGTTIVTSALKWDNSLSSLSPQQQTKKSSLGDSFVFQQGTPATVVTTQSGSKYQLGEKKQQQQTEQEQQPSGAPLQRPSIQSFQSQRQQQQQAPKRGRGPLHPSNKLYPNLEYKLTGQSISNGLGTKYLLAGIPKRKPSGRSEIIMAYKADEQSRPITDMVYIVKLSKHKEKLEREYNNYCRVQQQQPSSSSSQNDGVAVTATNNDNNGGGGGWMGGMTNMLFDNLASKTFDSNNNNNNPFVKCYDFLPVCEGSIIYAQHSALILEKGYEDLRDYEYKLQTNDRGQDPTKKLTINGVMNPILVQSSLLSAAKCLDTLHTRARLVYTDLKAENLIFMSPEDQQYENFNINVMANIKGIDLESCISVKGHPLDYTPEACPPEFATKHLNGQAYDFVLEYNYDVWSFGMLAYELATGRAYFKGKTPTQIMKILGQGGFQPPLSTTSATNINGGNGGISNGYGNSYGTANNNDEKETPILIQDKHLVDLIRSCLQIDPKYRITVNQILRHSYFKQQLRQRQQQQAPPPQQQQQQEGGSNSGGGTYW